MESKIEQVVREYHEKKISLTLQKVCNRLAKDSTGGYFDYVQTLIDNKVIIVPNTTMWLLDSPLSGNRDFYALSIIRCKHAFECDFNLAHCERYTGGDLGELSHHLGNLTNMICEFMLNRGDELYIRDFSSFLYVISWLYLMQVREDRFRNASLRTDSLLSEADELALVRFYRIFIMSLALRKSDYNPNIRLGINSVKQVELFVSEYNSNEHTYRYEKPTFGVVFKENVHAKIMTLFDIALFKYGQLYKTHQLPTLVNTNFAKKSPSYEVLPSITQSYSEVVIDVSNFITYFNIKTDKELSAKLNEVYSYAQTINIARVKLLKPAVTDTKSIVLKVILTNCGGVDKTTKMCMHLKETDSQFNENYPYTFIYELEHVESGGTEYVVKNNSSASQCWGDKRIIYCCEGDKRHLVIHRPSEASERPRVRRENRGAKQVVKHSRKRKKSTSKKPKSK